MTSPIIPFQPKWIEVAVKEIGQEEISGPKDNPRIVQYHKTTTLSADDDETPWCSSFVNWCMKEAGIKGTGLAMARSWLNWGVGLKVPAFGCITILSRQGAPTNGHVAFLIGHKPDAVLLLGGNQGDKVSASIFPKNRVLGYRWP